MRKLDTAFIAAGIASLSMLIGVSSCEHSARVEEVEKPTRQTLEATIGKDQWKVTSYEGESADPESFKEFTFQFLDNGSIMASSSGVNLNGVWSTFDSKPGQLKLNLEFELKQPLDKLNSDWVVVERTDSRIILNDVARSSIPKARVTLEKV